jgi:hypothetical protein
MKMKSKYWCAIIPIKPLSNISTYQNIIKKFWHHFDREFVWSDFEIWSVYRHLYPVHLLVIPMYIWTSQSLFSHSYVVNEWLNRHCDVQIDIGIRADEQALITSNSCQIFRSDWHVKSNQQNFKCLVGYAVM